MHGAYRREFGPENVVELSKNIIVQHEDYLKQDDPDKKADALRYMAGYVAQYLHLVPHEKKFTYKETERVLHNSAMNIGDFDPREGSLSFRNLAKYAENLMEQPWRKDFHVIKLTSGFYVHNISAQLQNAHEILIVLGYVNIDDTTLKLLPNLNYTSLKAVSRDCYIASQECLILSQIWQQVADQEPEYPLTIGEVFEYRKNHLGDTVTICNKLLFDIRSRMHLVNKQKQLLPTYPHNNNHNHQSVPVPMLKNSQRFVPVDRLIDYDGEEMNVDEPDGVIVPQNHNFIPEREIDRAQDLIKNVNLYSYGQEDEHIYDPVYGGAGDPPSVPNHQYPTYQRRHSTTQAVPKPANNLPGQYFYNNNSNSRKSVPAQSSQPQPQPQQPSFVYNPYQSSQQFHNNFNNLPPSNNLMMYGGDERNSVSPMIPKTVTSLFSNSNGIHSSGSGSSRNNVSKSNSMNSISGNRPGIGGASSSSSSTSQQQQQPPPPPQSFLTQPLTRTKVKETDLDEPLPRENNMPYFNQGPVLAGKLDVNRRNSRKTIGAVPLAGNFQSQSQVYPDEYSPPGIVKPVAVYGSSSSSATNGQFYMRPRQNSDNSEDVLNDAYNYASEVSQISRVGGSGSSSAAGGLGVDSKAQLYQHQATPIPMPGSDSDSHSFSSENKSRGGSVRRELASSREGSVLQYGRPSEQPHHQPLPSRRSEPISSSKRPTHIDLRPKPNGGDGDFHYADSSPETDLLQAGQQPHPKNKNGYRELSSSSSGDSPASGSAPRSFPRNEDLSSLDTVYYDYLLKKGQTDEVMGNNSNSGDCHHHQFLPHQESKRSSRTSTSSHHHHQQQQQHQPSQNNYMGSDPEENHMYDGRRVIPKKKTDKSLPRRVENDTRRRKQQNPVESVIPSASTSKYGVSDRDRDRDPSYSDNLSSALDLNKPSHDKDMRNNSAHTTTTAERDRDHHRYPVESEVPSTSPPKKEFEPWDCRHCTYKNTTAERICDMCAKSKDFYEEDPNAPQTVPPVQAAYLQAVAVTPKLFSVPNSNLDSSPLGASSSSGGAIASSSESSSQPAAADEEIECPQCTLLNPRRARICDACGFRLKKMESPKNLEELAYDIR